MIVRAKEGSSHNSVQEKGGDIEKKMKRTLDRMRKKKMERMDSLKNENGRYEDKVLQPRQGVYHPPNIYVMLDSWNHI